MNIENEQKLNRRQVLRNVFSDVRLFAEGCALTYLGCLREDLWKNPEQSNPPIILRYPVNRVLFWTGLLTVSWAVIRRLPEDILTRKVN